jgi:hypothetical protein
MGHEEDLTRFGTLLAVKNYKEDRIKLLTKLSEEKDDIIADRDQTLRDI